MVAQVTGYSVTLSDAQRRIAWVNDSFVRLTGYSLAEAVGRRISELLYFEGTDPGTIASSRKAYAAHSGVRFEIRVRGKDGREWWLDTDAQPLRDANGELTGWAYILADSTEQVLKREASRLISEQLALIADNVPGMIFQWQLSADGVGRFLYVSPGVQSVYGVSQDTLMKDGRALRGITHAEDRVRSDEVMWVSQRTLRPWHLDHRIVRPNGTIGWVEGDAVPRRTADGATIWNGYVGDVTQSKRAQEELRISEAKLRSLYDLSPLGIALNDMEGRFLQINRSVEIITGYSNEEILTTNWLDWAVTDGNSNQRLRLETLVQGGRFGPVEMSLRRKDGSRVPVQITGIIVHSTDGQQHIWSMVEDISVRKRSEQRISFLAYHDALTGLENRLGLRARLEEKLRATLVSQSAVAVALIDLDRFKIINDTLGHDVGDELLVQIARRLKSGLRESDVAARLGGDEFVLVLGGIEDDMQLEAILQKLIARVRGNVQLGGRTVYSTCSVGVSISPRDGTDSSTLLKHADLAMYTAKAHGGDAFRLFDNSMRQGTDRLSIEVELRDAMERGELQLYYQPRVDTVTGRPTALEALLRWNHPLRGQVLPASFIPIAEETGLIEAIGHWVLTRACHDARAWMDAGGQPLRVSVNLSPVQFAREELTERIATVLSAARLPARLLELEITETAAMRSPELAARHMARLRALGVSLAIDDFGTGHSSLSRLKLLNVDCVKIDRSLIKDCTGDAHDAALCRAGIALGRALGLEVVAEGVETAEQRQFLLQEHCTTIQGYLIARPMPAQDAFTFVRALLKKPRYGAEAFTLSPPLTMTPPFITNKTD